MVQLNTRDFVYPEYPLPQMGYAEKIVPDMWVDFKNDNQSDLNKAFLNDLNSDDFEIGKIIKDEDDCKACIDFLKDNMAPFMTFQKQLMFMSNKYPQINWEVLFRTVDALQTDSAFPYSDCKIIRGQLEIIFMRATRNDKVGGLRGAVQRAELLDFMMRLAR